MVEMGEEYWSSFLRRVRYLFVRCACRLLAHLEVALFVRVRVVVSPPLGGHVLKLEHDGGDVGAVGIDYASERRERAGKAAVKGLQRRTDGVQRSDCGDARSSDGRGALICFEAEADGPDNQGKLQSELWPCFRCCMNSSRLPIRWIRAPLSERWAILWGSRSFKRGCAVLHSAQPLQGDDGYCGGYVRATRTQGQGRASGATPSTCTERNGRESEDYSLPLAQRRKCNLDTIAECSSFSWMILSSMVAAAVTWLCCDE